jgi:hypothetical protein
MTLMRLGVSFIFCCVVGCGSFATGSNPSSSSSSSSPDASDAADGGVGVGVDSGFSVVEGGAAPVLCFDLSKQASEFTKHGSDVGTDASGYAFRVDGSLRGISHAFTSPTKITLSQFKIDMTIENTSGAGTSFAGWVDLVALYYGDPPALYETAAQNLTVTTDGFEVNAWWAKGQANYDGPPPKMPLFPFGGGAGNELVIETKWADRTVARGATPSATDGFVSMKNGSGTKGKSVALKTSTISANKVTLFIGGQASNGAPPHNFRVRSVCVNQN